MSRYQWDNEEYDARDEERPSKQRYSCPDRMCGADDCPNCRPGNFRAGVYVDDIKEDEDIDPAPNICPKCKSASTDCGCD